MDRFKGKFAGLNEKARCLTNRAVHRWKREIQTTLTKLLLPPSPTPHLLWSNELPTETELGLILNTISHAEAKAQRLTARLASKGMYRVGAISHRLTEISLNRVNETIVQHKRMLSPGIRRVPFEVLEVIFALSTFDSDYYEIGSSSFYRDVSSLPLSQSLVCKFWRYVALSSPRLWSRIPTIYLDRRYSRTRGFLTFLDNLLDQRCKNIPINFHIALTSPSGCVLPHPAVTILVSHSAKWKTAVLDMTCFGESEMLAIKGCLPKLETLAISRLDEISQVVVDSFQVAPQLREVIYGTEALPELLVPNCQLLLYRIFTFRHSWVPIESFSRFTSLRALELTSMFEARDWYAGQEVTLPSLTTLQLRMRVYNGQLDLLEALKLPCLKNLSVNYFGDTDISLMSPIINLIHRSGIFSLERLHIRSKDSPGMLTSLLRHNPRVENLNIDFPPIEDLTQLVQSINIVAPLLQVCTFHTKRLLNNEEASLCRQLVFTGREAIDSDSPILHTFYIEFDPLVRSLQFDFKYDPHLAFSHQRALHGWTDCDVGVSLKTYDEILDNNRLDQPDVQPSRYLQSILGRDHRSSLVLSTLSSIEKMEVNEAKDLYVRLLLTLLHMLCLTLTSVLQSSPILSTLESLVQTSIYYRDAGIPESKAQKLAARRSELILEKWKPLIESSLNDIHWVIVGIGRIVYVPSNTRKSISFWRYYPLHFKNPLTLPLSSNS